MDDKYTRFWLGVKQLGEELAKEKMWDSFIWLDDTLGSDCPKLIPVAKYLISKPEIGTILKEMYDNYGTG